MLLKKISHLEMNSLGLWFFANERLFNKEVPETGNFYLTGGSRDFQFNWNYYELTLNGSKRWSIIESNGVGPYFLHLLENFLGFGTHLITLVLWVSLEIFWVGNRFGWSRVGWNLSCADPISGKITHIATLVDENLYTVMFTFDRVHNTFYTLLSQEVKFYVFQLNQ